MRDIHALLSESKRFYDEILDVTERDDWDSVKAATNSNCFASMKLPPDEFVELILKDRGTWTVAPF